MMLTEILEVIFALLTLLMSAYLVRHYLFTLIVLQKPKKVEQYPAVASTYHPTVSILIPALDEERVIGRILKRITELSYPKDKLQVIVIDDGSLDATGEIARYYSERYNYVTLVQRSWREGRHGKASALNFGMKQAKCEIVLCFDADYYPQKDIVEKLVRAFEDPKVGAVQGRVVVLNEPKNLVTRIVALERIGGYRIDQEARDRLGLITQYGGTVGGFRRDIIESLGGFDESMLAEDTDLTLRVYLAGYKVKYEVDAQCYEEAVDSWKSYWRQRKRWSMGHMQCAFKYSLKILRSKNLKLGEKIDGLLMLNVYFMPIVILIAWIIGIPLFLLKYYRWFPVFWSAALLFMYSSFGNFAPFYEVAAGAYLDGRSRACWLTPLLIITSLYSVLICTKALLDLLVSKLRKRTYPWEKTEHKGDGNYYIMRNVPNQ
ncbi:MAG: glycosyltransferase family 2 protein [Candidatus Bathyarchaeota archaeon]|nr:glycosyltransferase family 2 protein [Candidatus Bathyarchaeota archaeon]MCX8176884.1 glycosyltransferase family 2 protein [Candidatus Bathyarchaeota archaeon]MDW8193431.1 glycosyltransferase family 2 protein [Nitrososphaerota archaeon]